MQEAIKQYIRTLISRGLSQHTIIAYRKDLLQLNELHARSQTQSRARSQTQSRARSQTQSHARSQTLFGNAIVNKTLF